MAIYHASTKSLSRSDGRSAVAAVAYRAGVRLEDLRTGLVHDYSRRHGVVSAEILSPDGGEIERLDLWNAVEAAEKRKDSRTGREWVLALPDELDAEQRHGLARSFAAELVRRYGVAVDMAIHEPSRAGDERNHHAHLFATTRSVTRSGTGALVLGEKVASELSDTNRRKLGLKAASEEVAELRQVWEGLANEALERAGSAERIDHRSLEAQGIDREATTHLGPCATAMERRGEASERGEINRQAEARNAERERLAAEIIDLQAERERRAQEARAELEREAEAARAAEIAQKAAEALQERERRQREAEARKAQEEAQRAAEAEQERLAQAAREEAEAQRQAAQNAEAARLKRMSIAELTQAIQTSTPPMPDEMKKYDRAVRATDQARTAVQTKVWNWEYQARHAEISASEWRSKHRLLAWLHDREWLTSSKLIAWGEKAQQARQEAERLQPELTEAEEAATRAEERVDKQWFAMTLRVRFMRELLQKKQEAEIRQAAQERADALEGVGERIEQLARQPEKLRELRSGLAEMFPELDAEQKQAAREAVERIDEFLRTSPPKASQARTSKPQAPSRGGWDREM